MVKKETSAGGIVYKKNSNGEVEWLICQHSQHHGWVFPKGLVGDQDKNETNEIAALRETEEEGGVKARIIVELPQPFSYTYTYKGTPIEKTVYYYLMEYISGDPSQHDFEMEDAKFTSEAEIKKLLTYPSDQDAFQEALKLFGGHVLK